MTAPAEPRRWELPPEPGPEVTVVRDADDELWWRTPAGWRLRADRPPTYLVGPAHDWAEVMSEAPVVDVTAEHPDYNPAEVTR